MIVRAPPRKNYQEKIKHRAGGNDKMTIINHNNFRIIPFWMNVPFLYHAEQNLINGSTWYKNCMIRKLLWLMIVILSCHEVTPARCLIFFMMNYQRYSYRIGLNIVILHSSVNLSVYISSEQLWDAYNEDSMCIFSVTLFHQETPRCVFLFGRWHFLPCLCQPRSVILEMI